MLLALFVVVFGITLARAAWLQTVQASSLASKGASQQRETLTVPAGRGTIFDRSGVQLAIGEQATTVYANPREIVNAALFLASDESSFVNGAAFVVDGGLTAAYVTPE